MNFDVRKIPVHPLAAQLRPLHDYEKKALERSMQDVGFDPKFPLVLFEDPKLGMTILAGRHRRDFAVKLGIPAEKIAYTVFEGDAEAAARFVALEQLGRRNAESGERAFLMAVARDKLGLDLESAAAAAGCSLSQMEKASAVAHKSKKFTARGLRGEISPSVAASRLKRCVPETHTDGEDPWIEIERTKDRMKVAMNELIKWVEAYLEPVLDRRGGEMLKANLKARGKRDAAGNLKLGLGLIDEALSTIRRNMPAGKCPTCNGAGCDDCKDRRYITANEKAFIRNEENAK